MTYKDIVVIARAAAAVVNPSGFFVHGRKTDGSLHYDEEFPQILLLEPQPNPNNANKEFVETISFPIIFVAQDSPDSTELGRENLKEAMFILSRDFLKELEKEDLVQFSYSSAQPEIRQLAATATGFSFTLNATYSYLAECEEPVVLPPTVELFANDTVVTAGQTIRLAFIAYNVETISIDNGIGNVGRVGYVDVVINSTTTFIASVSNSAGSDTDSLTIEVAAACADATAVLKDTAGLVLSTTDIPSGDSQDIIAPNGTANIENTNNDPIASVAIKSGEAKLIILNDIVLTINDQDGNPLSVTGEVAAVDITKVVNVPVTLIPTIAVDDAAPDTNQTVQFTGGCSNGVPTSWFWDFGDGRTSTLQNPTHEYEYAGTYDVALSITDGSSDGVLINLSYIVVTLQGLAGTPYAWYKAGIGASPSNMTLVSGNVSQWNDESGNGFHITQATVGNRPSYTDNLLNSWGGVLFNGILSCLFRADAAMSRPAVQTIMMLIKRLEVGANGDIFCCSEPSNSASVIECAQYQGFKIYNGGAVMANFQPTLLGDYFVLTCVMNGANSYIYIDNLDTIFAANTVGANTSTGIVLGANASKLGNPNFLLIETIVFNSALSTADKDENVLYFNSKFRLHLHV